MKKEEVITYMKKNKKERFKLDWWAEYMFIFFNGNDFISGGGDIVDMKFLLDGNFIRAKDDDSLLGGLFAL